MLEFIKGCITIATLILPLYDNLQKIDKVEKYVVCTNPNINSFWIHKHIFFRVDEKDVGSPRIDFIFRYTIEIPKPEEEP